MIQVDLSARYSAAFGFISANISNALKNALGLGFKGEVMLDEPNTGFDSVDLINGDLEINFAATSISDDFADTFGTPPMLSWRRNKRLVTTPINDSDFEIVERYATEPWEVQMRGLIIDMENHNFPLDKLRSLNEIFEQNSSWEVISDIFQALGVTSIYFKSASIDFVEGYPDTVAYTFTARAIKSAEYQLITQQ